MLLFALAIAPGLAICLFIYSRNKYGKKSLRYLIVSFILGMASTLPALILQLISNDIRKDYSTHGILSIAWFAYIVVGLSEESSKFLMLRLYAFPKQEFRAPFDGIVYAVMIGMGFATLENLEYVERFGAGAGISRFFLSVPAHASFAVLMGYNVGLAKLRPTRAVWLMLRGLLIAVLFHGSFDFFLFLQQDDQVKQNVSQGLLSFGSFATFYIAIRLAMRTIRMHKKYDIE